MPRKIKSYGRQDLIDVTLPNHADSYTVISHKSVMDLSTEALKDAGFSITAENYRATHDGNIASAIYTLNFGNDPELSMMFAWSNSYNKQMRFKCGVGAIHNVNNTSLVCGDMGSWARKHTGSADTETKETIEQQVKLAKVYYEQLCSDKESMKKINLDIRKQSQILGMLFAEHDILTTEQASMIKQQMSRPTYKCTEPGTLWEFYNFVTIALQQSHPKTWMEDQRVLHWFISDTFKFNKIEDREVNEAVVDIIPENSEVETKDPAQIDLVDSIAEIEAENAQILTEDKLVEARKMFQANDEDSVQELVDVEFDDDGIPLPTYDEDQIAERIKEDEAAVAEVCDEPSMPLGSDDMNLCPDISDAEAADIIKGQEAVDRQMAQEAEADNSVSDENIDDTLKGEPDFNLDFTPTVKDEEKEDIQSGDFDFDFA
jgi:hypothetical protein